MESDLKLQLFINTIIHKIGFDFFSIYILHLINSNKLFKNCFELDFRVYVYQLFDFQLNYGHKKISHKNAFNLIVF